MTVKSNSKQRMTASSFSLGFLLSLVMQDASTGLTNSLFIKLSACSGVVDTLLSLICPRSGKSKAVNIRSSFAHSFLINHSSPCLGAKIINHFPLSIGFFRIMDTIAPSTQCWVYFPRAGIPSRITSASTLLRKRRAKQKTIFLHTINSSSLDLFKHLSDQ